MNKTRSILAAAALAAVGATSAVAQGAETSGTPVSRDEVVAELRAMQAAGVWTPIQEVSPTALEAIEQERKMFSGVAPQMSDRRSWGPDRMERDRSARDGMSRGDTQIRSPIQDETRSLQNVPNQQVPPAR